MVWPSSTPSREFWGMTSTTSYRSAGCIFRPMSQLPRLFSGFITWKKGWPNCPQNTASEPTMTVLPVPMSPTMPIWPNSKGGGALERPQRPRIRLSHPMSSRFR